MGGKPDGKNPSTKKDGAARKAAKDKAEKGEKIAEAFAEDLRDIIRQANRRK